MAFRERFAGGLILWLALIFLACLALAWSLLTPGLGKTAASRKDGRC